MVDGISGGLVPHSWRTRSKSSSISVWQSDCLIDFVHDLWLLLCPRQTDSTDAWQPEHSLERLESIACDLAVLGTTGAVPPQVSKIIVGCRDVIGTYLAWPWGRLG